MVAHLWTREENEQFKNLLQFFSAFSRSRFNSIAEYMQKPVVDVLEHYEELVDDLLEMGSSQFALPDELAESIAHNLYQIQRTLWNKEEHEWFLIGLKKFGKDYVKIAVLVDSKNPMQIAIYAHNYFHWDNSKKIMKKRQRSNDITIMDSTGQQENIVHPQPQPQQEPIVLEIGQHAKVSNSKSYLP